LENLVITSDAFWQGRRVLVTGHTGFKGSWLSLWLHRLGARVTGYALDPPTSPSLFELAGVVSTLASRIGDLDNYAVLRRVVQESQPEIVFHLAAQPLVRAGYEDPASTYRTNVLGTVHLLQAVRETSGVRAVVNVTTDKCYQNREWDWGYREIDPLGGFDPYSSSKACSELVTDSFRQAFIADGGIGLASARAGNVIGGGDWGQDRLLPDLFRAFEAGQPAMIRRPRAVRPWQHVLEPLSGYLLLARQLLDQGSTFAEAWNFGPDEADAQPVRYLVERITALWGEGARWQVDESPHPHEANVLRLDCAKARTRLGWRPRLDLDTALAWTVAWHKACGKGSDLRRVCESQIEQYEALTG
jgi:CDP-glucose 4,6-dehydratase